MSEDVKICAPAVPLETGRKSYAGVVSLPPRHAKTVRLRQEQREAFASEGVVIDDPHGREADRARAAWERKTPGPFITTDGMVLDGATWRPATFEEMHPRYVCAVKPRKPKRTEDEIPGMEKLAKKGVLFLYPYTPAGPRGRLNLRENDERIKSAWGAEQESWIGNSDGFCRGSVMRENTHTAKRAARVVRMARKKRRGYA